MKKVRINNLDMTTLDVIAELSDGIPGALTVMMLMLEKADKIDPSSALGGLGSLLSLDTHGIYGSRIWRFYKDVCEGNLSHVLALLRAVQLGFLSESSLNKAIDGEVNLNKEQLIAKVKEFLPDFNIENSGTHAAT